MSGLGRGFSVKIRLAWSVPYFFAIIEDLSIISGHMVSTTSYLHFLHKVKSILERTSYTIRYKRNDCVYHGKIIDIKLLFFYLEPRKDRMAPIDQITHMAMNYGSELVQ